MDFTMKISRKEYMLLKRTVTDLATENEQLKKEVKTLKNKVAEKTAKENKKEGAK